MKNKVAVKVLKALGGMAVEVAPSIIDSKIQKKEEKSFFEENKRWIYIIILSIFVTNLNYINISGYLILNSIINIIYGIIVLILLCLFYNEEKNNFKINSPFIKTLIVSLIILGIINFLCHITFAISSLLAISL